MKQDISKPLTAEEKAELEALAALPDAQIDTHEMTEIRDWTGARRGALYRPVKRQLTLRLDADLIEWFKQQASDTGYQTRINSALREYVDQHKGSPVRS